MSGKGSAGSAEVIMGRKIPQKAQREKKKSMGGQKIFLGRTEERESCLASDVQMGWGIDFGLSPVFLLFHCLLLPLK